VNSNSRIYTINGEKNSDENISRIYIQMHISFYIIHAEWCHHCVTLLETMQTIGGVPSKNGEYNVKGTIVKAIEQKELNNPETQNILGNIQISGFPTILIKNNNDFNEYNGLRDSESLLKLFKKNKKQMRRPIVAGQARKTARRKTARRKTARRKTARRKTARRKTVSWIF
jgi:arsenate reductase-like glutaredoxin family protein